MKDACYSQRLLERLMIGVKKKPFPKQIEKGFKINMAATYSPGTKSSTMGHEGLNFSVRYGKR